MQRTRTRRTKPALWTAAFPPKLPPAKTFTGNGMSNKRRGEHREYTRLRVIFLGENPRCQRPGCKNRATCVHHWAGRRSNFLKTETWRASCWACNDWAKNDPKGAREAGWIAPVGVYLT